MTGMTRRGFLIYLRQAVKTIRYIKIKNYKSIGETELVLNQPGKINLLIGANNAGKSNILRFISLLGAPSVPEMLTNTKVGDNYAFHSLAQEDHRNYKWNKPVTFTLGLNLEQNYIDRIMKNLPVDDVYITYQIVRQSNANHVLQHIDSSIHHVSEPEIRQYEIGTGTSGGSFQDALARTIGNVRLNHATAFPKVVYLDEFRRITNNQELRKKLNDIINFDHTTQENAEKKALLCEYFKEVFGFEVDIKIPSIDKEIQIVVDGQYHPLSSLGTGYQEIVLIAFTIITTDADVICIDEPELHLHPRAQRAMLNLMAQLDKVFFLATHSNHFLDFEIEDKKIYQIVNESGETIAYEIDNSAGITEIIHDLGIRASELYQTNGIIWVEGASDRIYIKKWLELLHPDLKEGLQYTFQFYGGKVLSHYSLSDEEYKNYLNMLLINKNCFVVMDSDMTKSYKVTGLRDTKQRVIKECEENGMGYWVTKGKEIENYLTERSLSTVEGGEVTRNIYQSLDGYCTKYNPKLKVHFARKIESEILMEDIEGNEDLKEKIDSIASAIRKWNL